MIKTMFLVLTYKFKHFILEKSYLLVCIIMLLVTNRMYVFIIVIFYVRTKVQLSYL